MPVPDRMRIIRLRTEARTASEVISNSFDHSECEWLPDRAVSRRRSVVAAAVHVSMYAESNCKAGLDWLGQMTFSTMQSPSRPACHLSAQSNTRSELVSSI